MTSSRGSSGPRDQTHVFCISHTAGGFLITESPGKPQKVSSVQLLSHVWLCDPMDCSTPDLPVYHQLPELTQTHVYLVSDAIQPSHPLPSPSPLTFSLSQHQGLFQWVSSLHQVAKVLELQLRHQSFNKYSGLISFRVDWFDLLSAQRSLKSLLQHHSSKVSIHQFFSFFRKSIMNVEYLTLTTVFTLYKQYNQYVVTEYFSWICF